MNPSLNNNNNNRVSPNSPYKLSWLDLDFLGFNECIAIGGLPGVHNRYLRRNLDNDKAVILREGISHVFLLCEESELERFGVPALIKNLCDDGMEVHYFPCESGSFPAIKETMIMIEEIFSIISRGKKCILISRDGFGRAGTVGASILLHTMDNLTHHQAYDAIKKILGSSRAIETVRQYNYLVDFRQLRDDYYTTEYEKRFFERSISR